MPLRGVSSAYRLTMPTDADDLPPMSAPTASRPVLPPGYGLPDDDAGMLDWADVQARLVPSLHYWLASVRPDSRPHLVPRWGVWLDGRFWYDGAPTTRHARNVSHNPQVALSLENGQEAVIVEGVSQAVRASAAGLGTRLAAAFGKYHALDYAPTADSWAGEHGGGLRVLTPERAMAWFSFPTDCTRFTW